MKLSILIPVYNEEKTIIDVLQRIIKTKGDDIDYEIIVINDGSTDGTKKLLEEKDILKPFNLQDMNENVKEFIDNDIVKGIFIVNLLRRYFR